MTAPHDAPEAVEAMQIYAKSLGADMIAAMLRRLHARAEVADQAWGYLATLLKHMHPQCEPLPDLMGLCTQIDNAMTEIPTLRAALATARADALNEAVRLCDKHARFAAQGGPHTCDSTNGALWYGREQYARLCANEIGALIPQENPHAE